MPPIGIVAVPPPAGERDIGPRRGRGAYPKKTIATTDTTPVSVTGNPLEWAEFGGTHTGYEASFDGGATFQAIDAGDLYPWPDLGNLLVRASSSAAGSCVVRAWSYDAGMVRAASRAIAKAIIVGPGGLPAQATAFGLSTRIALATGVPGTFTPAASTIFSVVKAKSGNAALAYIANTVAAVAVAGTRFEMAQSDWITVYGSFGYDGTTGDHLFVQEFR